jgi:hypothetical protein
LPLPASRLPAITAVPAIAAAAITTTSAATATAAPATTTAAVAATSAAVTSATTTAAPATAATAGSLGLWPRFVHHQVPSAEILTVQRIDRAIRIFVIGHFNEGEPARLPRKTIAD